MAYELWYSSVVSSVIVVLDAIAQHQRLLSSILSVIILTVTVVIMTCLCQSGDV